MKIIRTARPETRDKTINLLNDMIDCLEAASNAISSYRESWSKGYLKNARRELISFKECHRKVNKRKMPKVGVIMFSEMEGEHRDLVRQYNHCLKNHKEPSLTEYAEPPKTENVLTAADPSKSHY